MAESNNDDLYKYTPSIAAATIFAVAFGLLTILHGYQLIRTQTWYFIAFCVGGAFETIGFVFRALSASQKPDYEVWTYAASQVGTLVAPSLLAASMYMELGRIILLTDGQRYAILRVTWLTKVFVAGDVVAFLVQMMGAGIMSAADDSSTSSTGKTVIVIGLLVQIVFFVLFVNTATVFHLRISRNPTDKIQKHSFPWKKHLLNVYACSVLVLIRCIIRVVEYAMGEDAYLMANEWVIYVFDALLIVAVMAAFAIIHPSEIKAFLNGAGVAMTRVLFTKQVSLNSQVEEVTEGYRLV